MTTDKTGAETTVHAEQDRFTIDVDGRSVGLAQFVDTDSQRIFTHTEVATEFEGRGLATILVTEALTTTRDTGMRIVAVCPMVAAYLEKHPEFADDVDPVDRDVKRRLSGE
jgi:uncharacterized protein